MSLLSFFSGKLSGKQLAQLAGQVVQRSQVPVRKRVERRAAMMRISEAVGYIRVRAAEIIEAEIEQVLQTYSPKQAVLVRAELTTLATEAVVSTVIRDLTCLPLQQGGRAWQQRRAA